MAQKQRPGLAPLPVFFFRLARNFTVASSLVAATLMLGMIGYHMAGLTWVDAFENASMILSGMGPLAQLPTDGGKIFAGCYALFSGLLFLSVSAVVLAPVAHRFLHACHLEANAEDEV